MAAGSRRRGRRVVRRRPRGSGVVDRLVEPLLGGVYAVTAAPVAAATVPALGGPRVGRFRRPGGRRGCRSRAATQAPVFTGVGRRGAAAGGRRHALRAQGSRFARARGAGAGARRVRWRLVTGPTAPCAVEVDAVVLAIPAAPARGCSRRWPRRRGRLAEVEYASVALVTLLLARAGWRGWWVPACWCRRSTAGTSRRRPSRPASGPGSMRPIPGTSSSGRRWALGEEPDLQLDDAEVVAGRWAACGRCPASGCPTVRVPGDAVGGRPAAVRRRAPGAGAAGARRRREATGAGRGGGSVRRGGGAGLRGVRSAGGRAGARRGDPGARASRSGGTIAA